LPSSAVVSSPPMERALPRMMAFTDLPHTGPADCWQRWTSSTAVSRRCRASSRVRPCYTTNVIKGMSALLAASPPPLAGCRITPPRQQAHERPTWASRLRLGRARGCLSASSSRGGSDTVHPIRLLRSSRGHCAVLSRCTLKQHWAKGDITGVSSTKWRREVSGGSLSLTAAGQALTSCVFPPLADASLDRRLQNAYKSTRRGEVPRTRGTPKTPGARVSGRCASVR
jgi:hypothetical protein